MTFSSIKLLKAFGSSKTSRNVGLRIILDDKDIELPSIPYSLAFKYSVLTPERKTTSPQVLEFSVQLENEQDQNPVEGDVLTIRAKMANVAKEKDQPAAVPMVVAVIGIPGGFEPRTDQLRELKDSRIVDFVESKPGQVILYWRALAPKAVVEVPIQVTAVIPGKFESPASRAYLFYNDEDKVWANGFTVTVDPSKKGKELRLW